MSMELKFLRSMWSSFNQPLGGHYKVINKLGAGGFGHTFLAKDLHLPGQPLCVVKQLKPQAKSAKELQLARRLFDNEAKVLYQLGVHPQIPRLLAHFEDNGEFYLAQELIQGQDLADEIAETSAWADARVVAFLGDVLTTLNFVHHHRVIHRDLKPSNLIRRQRDQRIVLIDFGAVKQASTQLIASETGVSHTISIGTQGYMPNEQIAGMPQFSSDIYAVGMMGIQMLTGRHPRTLTPDPRTGEVNWQCYAPHANDELIAVLTRMVRYDFRSRYATAAEALAAVKALPAELVAEIPPSLTASVSPSLDSRLSGPIHPNSAPTESLSAEATVSPPIAQDMPPIVLPSSRSEAVETEKVETEKVAPQIVQPSTVATTQSNSTIPVFGKPARLQNQPSSQTSSNRASSVKTELVTRFRATGLSLPKLGVSVAIAAVGMVGLGLLVSHFPRPVATESAASHQSPSHQSPSQQSAVTSAGVPVAPADAQPDDTSGAAKPSPPPVPQVVSVNEPLQQANQLREAGQYSEAIALYDTILGTAPDTTDAYVGKCYSLNQLQHYPEAIATCDQALSLAPDNPQALWSKGYGMEQQEDYGTALQLYNKAIAQDPTFAEAWNNKGTVLLFQGRHQDAVAAFDEAIALNPNLAEAWNNRGAALWSLLQFQQALTSVNRALEIQPDYQDAATLRQEMQRRLN